LLEQKVPQMVFRGLSTKFYLQNLTVSNLSYSVYICTKVYVTGVCRLVCDCMHCSRHCHLCT